MNEATPQPIRWWPVVVLVLAAVALAVIWLGLDAAVAPETVDAAAVTPVDGSPSYPQFCGPARDSRLPGIALARDWKARPPELLWRQEIGAGWSGFAVAGGLAVTLEQRGSQELVTAYELTTGRQVWAHADETRFDDNHWMGGVGPRTTPTIADGTVYTVGATGIVNSLVLETGELNWSRDVVADFGGRRPEWGYASSPLVLGDRVIVGTGSAEKSLVALRREDGELVWGAGDAKLSYASPLLTTLAGVPQVVLLGESVLVGHDPSDGRVLWRQPWDSNGFPTASQPLPLNGNRLMVSAAYGIGAKLFEIQADDDGGLASSLVWETPRFKAKFTQVIEIDGLVYGLDDGTMACFDPSTGERRWKRGRYGHGQTLLAGDLLLVSGEKGDVALVEPDPEGLRELGRFKAMDGKVWNPHALAGPYLLVRTDLEAACYKLPTVEP